ncbi:hypothetical protein PS687_02533 [Pseudomonas fluorescens]|jgi:hypothetical protein|nr:hypothetical protein PS687_02533 [Pseudomonas fluorescens]
MHYKAITTVHIQAMPESATFISEALSLAVAHVQGAENGTLCFLSPLQSRADEWIIHRHWSNPLYVQDNTDSLHARLMELLTSGQVRQMRFDTFTSDKGVQ